MKPANESQGPSILVVDDDQASPPRSRSSSRAKAMRWRSRCPARRLWPYRLRIRNIALALVDLIMPVMDGLALTDELRRRNPELTVVIMTGYGTIETAIDAIKRGAEDYVTKPFDYEGVRKKIAPADGGGGTARARGATRETPGAAPLLREYRQPSRRPWSACWSAPAWRPPPMLRC